MLWKWIGIIVLLGFYSIYIGKMLLQKRKGIQTDQIAKRKIKDRVYYIELIMKIATYSAVAAQIVSIAVITPGLPPAALLLGALLGIAGVVVFGAAVVTMRDNWRAGIAEGDSRQMITSGIYRFSRNPAFLGFDCVYLGLLLLFFNWLLLLFSVFAAVMLHLQILQEESYLPSVFGKDYDDYRAGVHRYFGRKR